MNPITCRDPSSLQITPALLPGQAPITPLWMVVEPRLCLPGRAGLTPQTLPALSQEKMRAKAAPTIRAKQASGEMPPPCRGADCTVGELIEQVGARFRVLYRGVEDQEALRGKPLLLLLPEQGEKAVADARWLLAQHGDFSGAPGKVSLTPAAFQWLGTMRGATELRAWAEHENVRHKLKQAESTLRKLVHGKGLGEVPALERLTRKQIVALGEKWLGKCKGFETASALMTACSDYLFERDALHFTSLLGQIERGDPHSLHIAVVTGEQTATLGLDQPDYTFPGLVLTPRPPQWQARALAEALQSTQAISVDFLDLQRKRIEADRPLAGDLVIVAVKDELFAASELASAMVEAIKSHPAGKVPVALLHCAWSIPVRGHEATRRLSPDEHVRQIGTAAGPFYQALAALLEFIGKHSAQEPLEPATAEALGHENFMALARARVDALPTHALKDQGRQLLADYHKRFQQMSRAYQSVQVSLLIQLARELPALSAEGAVGVLFLPDDEARALAGMAREAPALGDPLKAKLLLTRAVRAVPISSRGKPSPQV